MRTIIPQTKTNQKLTNQALSKAPLTMTAYYRVSPYAYQKILFMRDIGDSEVSGFAVTDEEQPDLITDFHLIKQQCTVVTTEMDSEGLADYLEDMVENGFQPGNCMRVWIHTHPGSSPSPSGTDEATFKELSSKFAYFVMLIIAEKGAKFGRLAFSQGCGGTAPVEWDVDWTVPGEAVDFDEWTNEYNKLVNIKKFASVGTTYQQKTGGTPHYSQYAEGYDFIEWGSNRSTDEDIFYERDTNPEWGKDFESMSDEEMEAAIDIVTGKGVADMTDEEFRFYEYFTKEVEND